MYTLRLLFSKLFAHPWLVAVALALIAAAVYLSYRRARNGVRVTKYLVGFIVCVVLLVFTTSKLYTMYQLKGRVGGATTVTYVVKQKWHDYSLNTTSDEMEHAYWVSWTDQDIKVPGHHRVGLSYEKWSGLKVGDPLEITYVPGDPDPYVRNDIFDSEGNFLFDYVLLLAEVAGAGWFMMKMTRGSDRSGDREESETIRLFK